MIPDEPKSQAGARSRRTLVLAVGACLFFFIALLRLAIDESSQPVTLLYVLPIAVIAVELGQKWGLAAAALALALFALWDVSWAADGHNALDYVARGAVFFVLGGAVGALADRLRRVSSEIARFWDLSTGMLAVADMDGYFSRLNPAWERTLGWSEAELRARPFIEFVHPEDRERTVAEASQLADESYGTANFENRYLGKDGEYRTLLWSSTAVPAEGVIYASARDVTERSRAEEKLRSSEQFLESVLENLPSMVSVLETDELRFVRLNCAGEQLLGVSREELIGKNARDLLPKEKADAAMARDREILASADVVEIPEERIETRTNGPRVLHTRKIAIRDAGGEPRFLLAISEDVTDLKLAEQQFRELLEAAPDAMVVVDRTGKVVIVNAQTEQLLGYRRDELIGEPIELLVPDRFRDTHGPQRREYQRAPHPRAMGAGLELFARRKDGSELPVEISLGPVETEDGTLVTAAIRDITGRRQIEAVAEVARHEAERANQAKSEFLSRMSHELRTPLNAVIGFGQLLEFDDLRPAQRDAVEQILKGGRHLLQLINEVLDISRIESGTIAISLEPVHLGSVLAESLSLIRPLADDLDVRLSGDPAELGDLHVRADQQRLKQVFINLLSNAVKYNRPGGTVSVQYEQLPEGRVQVSIEDTGRGMTSEQLERLFDPFDRLGAESTGVEGTGLGLPLSQRLAEAMGGTIAAASESGSGTTMRLELDIAEVPAYASVRVQSAPLEAAPLSRRRTVLYIEDNMSNLKLVERLLERRPEIRLVPAMHGQLGLELARQHDPDLILLDLHLPDLSGEEVLKRLKRDPTTAQIPVVVLSADANEPQIRRLRSSGAVEYLTKPIELQRLLDLVASTMPEGN